MLLLKILTVMDISVNTVILCKVVMDEYWWYDNIKMISISWHQSNQVKEVVSIHYQRIGRTLCRAYSLIKY